MQVGATSTTVGGPAPRAPDSRKAVQLTLAPGSYPVRIGGYSLPASLVVQAGQVQPVLLAVQQGRVAPGGVYAGVGNLNLGLQELSGRLRPLFDFHLVDQDGRALDRTSLLGRDTVIAAFHTTCHESCPLYTGLLFQLRKSAPDVRLLEVTTDPAADGPAELAAYRSSIGADWTFATGQPDDVTEFWSPLGVGLAAGDTHSSALALVDRYGFIRAGFTGVPDLGGRLPAPVARQLDAAGRSLLAGHGEGWGAPQVLDSLRTLATAGQASAGRQAPTFSLAALDGPRLSLEEFRGRPVILNFWWAGCPPCRREMPLLQRTADSQPNLALLLVDPVDGAAAARGFTTALHVHAPVLLDEGGRVAAGYGVANYPTTFFVHSDGTISSQYLGELSSETLAAHLSNL
jgi:cytochrome oxidase Cu insertion factor (SCO1/SenC/PrrC family)